MGVERLTVEDVKMLKINVKNNITILEAIFKDYALSYKLEPFVLENVWRTYDYTTENHKQFKKNPDDYVNKGRMLLYLMNQFASMTEQRLNQIELEDIQYKYKCVNMDSWIDYINTIPDNYLANKLYQVKNAKV